MDDHLPLTAEVRGEYLETIKRLARERFLQLEIATTANFERLRREAFFADGDSDPSDKT